MVNQSTLRFIHNVIFPADAPHGKAVSAHHLMHLITVQAGGIYNVACFKIAFGGMQAVAVLQPVNAGHRGGEVKVAAVYHCRFRQRQRIFPWADDRGRGRIKGAGTYAAEGDAVDFFVFLEGIAGKLYAYVAEDSAVVVGIAASVFGACIFRPL